MLKKVFGGKRRNAENNFDDIDLVNTAERTRMKPKETSKPILQPLKRKKHENGSIGSVVPFFDDNDSNNNINKAEEKYIKRTPLGSKDTNIQEEKENKGEDFSLTSIFKGDNGNKWNMAFEDNPMMMKNDNKDESSKVNIRIKTNRKRSSNNLLKLKEIIKEKAKENQQQDGIEYRPHPMEAPGEAYIQNENIAENFTTNNNSETHINVNANVSDSSKKNKESYVKEGIDQRFVSNRDSNKNPFSIYDDETENIAEGKPKVQEKLEQKDELPSQKRRKRDVSNASLPMNEGPTYKSLVPVECGELFSKVRHNHLRAVRSVLADGYNPDMKDEHGNTMMHVAAQNNLSKMVSLLSGFGASPSLMNKKGMTPLDFAELYKFQKLIVTLLSEGATRGTK